MKKFLIACLLVLVTFPAVAEDAKESAFDRVMRTGVLKCGYYVFPPVTYRDPNAKELSGFSIDMMNAIAKRASLKIEWTEEVTFGNWAPALQSRRFDAVCTPMFPGASTAKGAAFTVPFLYSGLSPMVRADDERFKDNDLARLNKPDVTFIMQDGGDFLSTTPDVFPQAKIHNVMAGVDGPTMLQDIVTKKADAILMDRNGEIAYNKNNPVKLRLVDPAHPVKLQSFTLAVGRGEWALKDFLDTAIDEMNNDGSIDRMMKKWESESGQFLRVAKPYEPAK
ncbi:MAG: transporter substrate-binding domain-containing protein [Alphaproteobacteria bacterium]